MSDELKKEIDEFLAMSESEGETSEEPETPVVSEEPEAPVEDVVEDTPEPTGEAEAEKAAPVEPEEDDELTTLQKQNELLQQRLNEAYTQKPVVADKPSDTPAAPQDFFGEWKFDDIVETQESLQKFLGEFAGKVVSVAKESILKDLPNTVSTLTNQQVEARQTVDGFYSAHPSLANVKPFVAQVVSTVASEHADWELPQVLTEAATRAYKALGLKQQVTRNEKRNPAFAPTAKGGQRGKPAEAAKSKLEMEIEELL